MWRILQQEEPDDYVLATGETHSVREFVELAFARIGRPIEWRGQGVEEKGHCAETGDVLIEIDPRYYRPTEVDLLLGDASKAQEVLGWQPETRFTDLVTEMVDADRRALRESLDLSQSTERTHDGDSLRFAGKESLGRRTQGNGRWRARAATAE